MQIQENISLKPYNTFGIDASAKYFSSFSTTEELLQLLHEQNIGQYRHMILGGGSNVLFTGDYDGWVLKNALKGIELVKEDDDYYYVRSAAGENWHNFVMHCIRHNYAGLENLSLIPGNVGASPMQNIGAYGVEIKDVFHQLDAIHIAEKQQVNFSANDCEFGYRESIFKKQYKGQFIITSVTYRLNKYPFYNTTYGAIQQELDKMGVKELSIKAIADAVINIRQSKLPDPAQIGNAGSFYKNPTIPNEQYFLLKEKHPEIVGYTINSNETKVAAGWLIEQCGWKGYRKGDAGCHARQALVLVNYGGAKGEEILQLSTDIMKSVEEKFGIILEREVNII